MSSSFCSGEGFGTASAEKKKQTTRFFFNGTGCSYTVTHAQAIVFEICLPSARTDSHMNKQAIHLAPMLQGPQHNLARL